MKVLNIEFTEIEREPVFTIKQAKTIKNETTRNEIIQQQDMENLNTNKNKNKSNKNHTHESEALEEKIEYAQKVFMTEREHTDLLNTYGEEMTNQLIEQLIMLLN